MLRSAVLAFALLLSLPAAAASAANIELLRGAEAGTHVVAYTAGPDEIAPGTSPVGAAFSGRAPEIAQDLRGRS